MALFDYTARHTTKGKVSGTGEAYNKVKAIKLVEHLGCTPITVGPHKSKPVLQSKTSLPPKENKSASQTKRSPAPEMGKPVCQLCGAAMCKTVVSSGNCAGIVVALIVFAVGIIIAIAIPVIGWGEAHYDDFSRVGFLFCRKDSVRSKKDCRSQQS